MKLQIRNHGTELVLVTDDGRYAYDIAGITIAPGDEGVQMLIQMSANELELSGDETSNVKETVDALLKALKE